MESALIWFEDLCTALSRSPVSVTPTLVQFRNSDVAHQLACHALSVSARSDVKFQALLVLKHTIVKRWKSCTPAMIYEFQSFLWGILVGDLSKLETFVLNKLIQVLCLNRILIILLLPPWCKCRFM
jgi:hypothetical protein